VNSPFEEMARRFAEAFCREEQDRGGRLPNHWGAMAREFLEASNTPGDPRWRELLARLSDRTGLSRQECLMRILEMSKW
jgi:hypothetical protein